jgi:hypothetical protein
VLAASVSRTISWPVGVVGGVVATGAVAAGVVVAGVVWVVVFGVVTVGVVFGVVAVGVVFGVVVTVGVWTVGLVTAGRVTIGFVVTVGLAGATVVGCVTPVVPTRTPGVGVTPGIFGSVGSEEDVVGVIGVLDTLPWVTPWAGAVVPTSGVEGTLATWDCGVLTAWLESEESAA